MTCFRHLAILAATCLATPALALGPEVHDARLYAAWSGATSAAAYMEIHNHGAPPTRLLGASSPAAASVAIHDSSEDGTGVVRMTPVPEGLPLSTDGVIAMEPGGLHVMLMGLEAPLEEGALIPLTLEFESGSLTLQVPVDIEGEGEEPPAPTEGDAGHAGH